MTHPSSRPTLTDCVVSLRPWRRSDGPSVFNACQDPDIARFMPIPRAGFEPEGIRRASDLGRSGRPIDRAFHVRLRAV